jgi:hypothetical protein
MQAKWQKAMASVYSDTAFIKKTGGFQVNQTQVQSHLKAELMANKTTVIQVLNKEIMMRKLKKTDFFKTWLTFDPETKDAAAMLRNVPTYQRILKP